MNSVLSKRIINKSVQNVFKAYSDPTLLIQWWGPHGFKNKFLEFDFSENGLWDFIMMDESGKEYPNQIRFKEIVPNEKIKAAHLNPPIFDIEINFIQLGPEQTEVQFKMIFDDEVVYNALKNYVPEKNQENFDRLEAVLM